jgi:hypothetical protein
MAVAVPGEVAPESAEGRVVARSAASGADDGAGRCNAPTRRGTFRQAVVRFTPIEWLRGSVAADSLAFPGQFVDRDDFNSRSVPYQIVRRSGQRGLCFAMEYRQGAEYLLLLRRASTGLSIRWMPLAPLNEQVRGHDDPWVNWVRERVTAG